LTNDKIVKLQAPASSSSVKALDANRYLHGLRIAAFIFLLAACGLRLELNDYPLTIIISHLLSFPASQPLRFSARYFFT
jgi:hypothetical protein